MENTIKDLINNIDSGSLADAEEIFRNIMDIRAGESLEAYRQQVANGIFNDEDDEYAEYESDEGEDDEDFDLETEDLGDDDAEI